MPMVTRAPRSRPRTRCPMDWLNNLIIDLLSLCLLLFLSLDYCFTVVLLVLVTVALLLARFGSNVAEVTVAVLTIRLLPRKLTLTVRVILADAPLASVPRVTVTVPPAPTGGAVDVPWVVLTAEKVVPCGTGSLTTTALAVPGPVL